MHSKSHGPQRFATPQLSDHIRDTYRLRWAPDLLLPPQCVGDQMISLLSKSLTQHAAKQSTARNRVRGQQPRRRLPGFRQTIAYRNFRIFDFQQDCSRSMKVSEALHSVERFEPLRGPGGRHVIVRLHSQWSHDIERWEKLTSIATSDWQAEMKRQRKRGWWKKVATHLDGSPLDPNVYFIHPLGWVDNFSTTSSIAPDDIDYLARTLYGEARGQSYKAKLIVGWIIRNRLKTEKWGTTYKAVVLARKQFTCWWQEVDPGNYQEVMNPHGEKWDDAKKAASEVSSADEMANPIPKAVNYYSPRAQRQLHKEKPHLYKQVPDFADPKKKIPNPPDISDDDFAFYHA